MPSRAINVGIKRLAHIGKIIHGSRSACSSSRFVATHRPVQGFALPIDLLSISFSVFPFRSLLPLDLLFVAKPNQTRSDSYVDPILLALTPLAGTLCCSGVLKLSNIPNLSDIQTMVSILKSLGVGVEVCNGEGLVDTGGIRSLEPCSAEVGKIRAGFFVLGPLLAQFGEAVVGLPGGCDSGSRPIELYVRGLRALGAIIELRSTKTL